VETLFLLVLILKCLQLDLTYLNLTEMVLLPVCMNNLTKTTGVTLMTTEKFVELFNAQIKSCKDILIDRASVYAPNQDRLENFKQAALLQSCTPVTALGGMLAKHIIAIYSFISSQESNIFVSPEQWKEKITDSINYLILLSALLEESSNV